MWTGCKLIGRNSFPLPYLIQPIGAFFSLSQTPSPFSQPKQCLFKNLKLSLWFSNHTNLYFASSSEDSLRPP